MSNIKADRGSQLLLASDKSLSYDEARARLDRASLYITAGAVADTAWGQAALLSIAACGSRMFRGGVFVDPELTNRMRLGQRWRTSIVGALVDAGCHVELPPETAARLHVGEGVPGTSSDLYCWAERWNATVSPQAPGALLASGNELSGVLCGAMAVMEIFRRLVLNDLLACRRPQTFDLWPGAPTASIDYLPKTLWLIGMGNLGQATLFTLGLLPFENPSQVSLLLQDNDIAGLENLPVQLLTQPDWIGRKKVRSAAAWAEDRGFTTIISERRFGKEDGPRGDEPRIALAGIDNLEGRRQIAAAGFDLVVDAGLGATGVEAFDVRVHSFPGRRDPATAWPEPEASSISEMPPAYRQLVEQGRLDECGAMMIAGQSVGVPCTALAAAALQLAQVCRCIASGSYSDLIDVTFRNPGKAVAHDFINPAGRRLPFSRAAVL